PGQTSENLILNTSGEISIRLVVAKIFKRQHRYRSLCSHSSLSRRGLARRITSQQKQPKRERRRDHNNDNPAAAGGVFLRRIGHFRSLEPLWCKFKRPG